jgi:CheY-like chemotaxis protein
MIRILIAEDNPANRELLRERLEASGYNVTEACNGQEALDMIAQTRPDLLLLDISMPVLDGFATVLKIRENPELSALPVLAVTAYAMRGDRDKVLNAGFDGYLSKPINARDLANELERLLRIREHRSATPNPSPDIVSRKTRATGSSPMD